MQFAKKKKRKCTISIHFHGLKAISRVDFCVIDADGKVAAKTFEDAQNCIADAIAFMDSPAESQVVNGYQFFKVLDDQNLEYTLSNRSLYATNRF